MRLKSLFSSVAMDQFATERRESLQFLLARVNEFLAPDTFLGDVDNLVELHNKAPDAFPRALKHVFGLGGLVKGCEDWQSVTGLDLFAGWLMDGGNAKQGWSLFRSREVHSLDSKAEDVEMLGLHSVVFELNYRESRLNLEGAARISSALMDNINHHRVTKGSLERISLEGFDKDPPESIFADDSVIAYWRHYFDPFVEKTDQRICQMVEAARGDYVRQNPNADDILDYLLKTMIYNPGLRLFRETKDVGMVIEELDPVLEAINTMILLLPGTKFDPENLALFKRQVFLNLFSPFPRALAHLEVEPGEMVGHPSRQFVEEKSSPWFTPRRSPIQTMKGPLQVFGCDRQVHAYFKHQQLPINLDWVLQGIVDDSIFKNLLVVEGKCDLLDYNLSRVADNLEVSDSIRKALKGYEFELEVVTLSDKAIIGAIVLMLEIGNDCQLPKPATNEQFERRLEDHAHYREKVKTDPRLKKSLLERLRLSPELLTHRALTWCGFGSDVLAQIDFGRDNKRRDDFFASDLGL